MQQLYYYKSLIENDSEILSQNATVLLHIKLAIAKCDILLQYATGITKCIGRAHKY